MVKYMCTTVGILLWNNTLNYKHIIELKYNVIERVQKYITELALIDYNFGVVETYFSIYLSCWNIQHVMCNFKF